MDTLIKEKEKLYTMYNKKLIDKAFEYLDDSRTLDEIKTGSLFELVEKLCKNKSVKEKGEEAVKLLLSSYIFTYLHGAIQNIGLTYDETYPDKEIRFSDYRKNKDFCLFYFFGDNDFGNYVEKGAKMLADRYNSCLSSIDSYKDEPNFDINNSLYVKDINEYEKIENIQKTLSYGIVSAAIENAGDFELLFIERGMADPKSIVDEAYGYIDYLKVNNDTRYKIGTYKEVEEMVKKDKRFTWKEGDSLTDMWFNGEALIIAVIDGEMKYWIK